MEEGTSRMVGNKLVFRRFGTQTRLCKACLLIASDGVKGYQKRYSEASRFCAVIRVGGFMTTQTRRRLGGTCGRQGWGELSERAEPESESKSVQIRFHRV